MSRARNWIFTLHNYNDNSLDKVQPHTHFVYMIAGREVCPTTQRKHLQGYVQFKEKVSFSTMSELIPGAHLEPAVASDVSNYNYCSKEGNLFCEIGTRKKQGKRNDIHSAVSMIDEGASMREVAIQNPVVYVKFHRGLEKYKAILIEPRNSLPTVKVFYGPTGSGKTRSARKLLPDAYVWGPEQERWFDGYEGQSQVIFEEFRGQLPFGMMLRLLDRVECRVQTKGGTIQFVGTNIIICSPVHPRDWYHIFENSEDKVDQLLRRITSITALKA